MWDLFPYTTIDCKTCHESFSFMMLLPAMPLGDETLAVGGFAWRVNTAWPCLGLAIPFLLLKKAASYLVVPPIPVFRADVSTRAG